MVKILHAAMFYRIPNKVKEDFGITEENVQESVDLLSTVRPDLYRVYRGDCLKLISRMIEDLKFKAYLDGLDNPDDRIRAQIIRKGELIEEEWDSE